MSFFQTELDDAKSASTDRGASLGPDALKAATCAFDEAWAEIASHFSQDPTQVEGARFSLANAIFSVTSDESRNVEVLKKAGLQVMASNYTSLPIAVQLARDAMADDGYWRRRADETRHLAQSGTDLIIQNELQNIAHAYERIARLTATDVKKTPSS